MASVRPSTTRWATVFVRLRRSVFVAGSRLDLGVAEEPGDHRQVQAEGEHPGRERVAQIVTAAPRARRTPRRASRQPLCGPGMVSSDDSVRSSNVSMIGGLLGDP